MKIILSPFSRNLGDRPHPKSPNLAWWQELVTLLLDQGHNLIQVGVTGEPSLVPDMRINLSLPDLSTLITTADTFVAIDSFVQHLAWDLGKQGVVIWGQSDPNIFGHREHINLLADRKYLREKQFWLWTQCDHRQEAFVTPEKVAAALNTLNRV